MAIPSNPSPKQWSHQPISAIEMGWQRRCIGDFIKLGAGMCLDFLQQDPILFDVPRVAFANATMTGNNHSIGSGRDLFDGVDPLSS